ncbi:MAG: hypothetical protein ACOCYQ_05995 [Alkalispirochaeta sp.]
MTKLPPPTVPDKDTSPAWKPPGIVAPLLPDGAERSEMLGWLRSRPTRVVIDDPPVDGAMVFPFRRYLSEIISAADLSIGSTAGETIFEIVITPELSAEASALNRYGSVRLHLTVALEGPEGFTGATSLTGPTMLSRLSSPDAQLNSLRAIESAAVRRAVETLRDELSGRIASRGIPYSITSTSGRADEVHAVFRSLGVPGGTAFEADHGVEHEVWYLFGSPVAISRELGDIFDGSRYNYAIHPLNRTITIIYNEEN